MQTQPRGIAETLMPAARRRVLGVLFTNPTVELHLREIVRRVGLAPATVQREVLGLSAAGILERHARGRQVYYRANRACPVFPELRGLVLKTVGLADVLKDALEPLGAGVLLAFVFGSLAEGADTPDSDVDLLVVGSVSLADLAPHLRKARETLARQVNVVSMTPEEFARGAADDEQFLGTVLRRPIMLVKGDPDEFGRLAGRPPHPASPDLVPGDW